MHVTYTWRRQRIKHMTIDPSKLMTAPIRNKAWPPEIR
jgi:hypothetical protein